MRIYLRIIENVIAESATYRLNHVVSFLTIAFPLVFALFLWQTVFTQTSQIGAFTLSTTLTYYFLVVLLQDPLYPGMNWEMVNDIREGTLSVWLLKPFPYPFYLLSVRIGAILPYTGLAVLLLSVLAFWFQDRLLWVVDPVRLLSFILAVLLAFVLAFLLSFLTSLSAFWTEEATGADRLAGVLIPLLSGQLLPIAFFPSPLRTILSWTPWRFTLDFPIQVYLATLPPDEVFLGFFLQVFWILVFVLLTQKVWSRGLSLYQAIGG